MKPNIVLFGSQKIQESSFLTSDVQLQLNAANVSLRTYLRQHPNPLFQVALRLFSLAIFSTKKLVDFLTRRSSGQLSAAAYLSSFGHVAMDRFLGARR